MPQRPRHLSAARTRVPRSVEPEFHSTLIHVGSKGFHTSREFDWVSFDAASGVPVVRGPKIINIHVVVSRFDQSHRNHAVCNVLQASKNEPVSNPKIRRGWVEAERCVLPTCSIDSLMLPLKQFHVEKPMIGVAGLATKEDTPRGNRKSSFIPLLNSESTM